MAAIIKPILCLVAILAAPASASSDSMERTTVWRSGEGDYKVYRIPSAVVTARGTLLAFCEGRRNGAGDSGAIDLIFTRSTDRGKTFSQTQVVWADGSNTCGNPCVAVDRSNNRVWLLMTHNGGGDSEKDITAGKAPRRTVWITSSSDDGATWDKPSEITSQASKSDWAWYATGPGIGIQLQRGKHAGRLVIPCDHVVRNGGGNSHVIYSDNHGATWQIGGEAPGGGFNESQCVELSDARVMLNMRNHRPTTQRTRGLCISDDGGRTFGDVRHDPVLVEPICQASILSTRDSILFANPASESKRVNLTVRLSRDDASTWAASKVIFDGPSAYSCLVALPDGSVGLLYECGERSPYERIEFARFMMP